LTVQRECIALY